MLGSGVALPAGRREQSFIPIGEQKQECFSSLPTASPKVLNFSINLKPTLGVNLISERYSEILKKNGGTIFCVHPGKINMEHENDAFQNGHFQGCTSALVAPQQVFSCRTSLWEPKPLR